MANTALFWSWFWKLPLPKPFDAITDKISKTYYSIYCTIATKKSTLHGPILSALLAYMEMDTTLTPASASENAIGTQGDKFVAEYKSRTGEMHVVVFNKKNGKFNVGRFDNATSSPRIYSLKDGHQTGTALFFSLIPEALADDEFRENYDLLGKCKNDGFTDMDETLKAAFILCDNLYRRIESADAVPKAAIKLSIPSTGNLASLTPLNLNKNAYSPSSVLHGKFTILTGTSSMPAAVIVNQNDFINKYQLSNREFTVQEKNMIPKLEDWYVIPPEVITICQHAKQTTGTAQPMRNFMFRGPAGTGKTESSKAVATGLGAPYTFFTCSADTEIYDILGQMLPEMEGTDFLPKSYPTLMDIQMDAPSAYYKLTGIYDENITDAEVYDKLIEVITEDAKKLASEGNSGQRYRYVESPIMKAIRNGYVLEIQEAASISKRSVLVGMNGLLDRCASVTLPTGEVVHRHPDSVVIFTTNGSDYAGCQDLNQSVISRMNLVMDIEAPDVNTMAERAMKVTGCTDKTLVTEMAASVQEISEHCKETLINDGCCGMRELISWVQSYMVCGNVLEAAKYTVLSSVSSDPENRADIYSTCLEQKFAA